MLAEHAFRLAMRAKVAAAAVAVASNDSKNDNDSIGYLNETNSNLCSITNPDRCVYSPLSPVPIKVRLFLKFLKMMLFFCADAYFRMIISIL